MSSKRMPGSRQAGTTLVELIIAMVIIGVAVAGVMQVFNVTAIASADPIVQKQLRAVAESMMDEVQRQPFSATANSAASGCARDTYNDIMDYNGYTSSQICQVTGTPVTALAGMSISVAVVATSLQGIPNADAYQITVTTQRGANSFRLTGWRSNYARGVSE